MTSENKEVDALRELVPDVFDSFEFADMFEGDTQLNILSGTMIKANDEYRARKLQEIEDGMESERDNSLLSKSLCRKRHNDEADESLANSIISTALSVESADDSERSYWERLVDKVFEKFNIGVNDKKKAEISVTVKGRKISIASCVSKSLEEEKMILESLNGILRDELQIVYYINYYGGDHPNAIYEERFANEVQYHRKLKHKSLVDEYIKLRVRAIWLVFELDQEQAKMIETYDTNETEEDSNKIVIMKSTKSDCLSYILKPPMIRPLPSDTKQSRLSFQELIHVRELIFREVNPAPVSRVELSGRLDQRDYSDLLIAPFEFLANILRYTQITSEEFIKVCYEYDTNGRGKSIECPCGRKVTATTLGINLHAVPCGFQKYLRETLPSLLRGNIVVPDLKMQILTESETVYLKSVIAKRKPVRKRVSDNRGTLTIEVQNDGNERVISSTPLDERDRHARQCAARKSCGACSSRKY